MKTESGQTDDSISLSSIKNAFLDLFNFVFTGFERIILSIKRHLALFIICCLLGPGIIYLYYILKPSYYASEMIVYHNDLTRRDYYEIVNNLNNLVLTQSYSDLEKELHLDKKTAENIQRIQVVKISGETLENDTSTKVRQLFKIRVSLGEFIETDQLSQAILNYLNNNPFLKRTKEGQKKIFTDKLSFIQKEQEKLDSLKSLYNSALASSKMATTFYNNAMNPADIYMQSNRLANQKDSIEKWLINESDAVILIDGMKRPIQTKAVSLRILLAIGLGIGFLIGILACILIAIRREALKRYSSAGSS